MEIGKNRIAIALHYDRGDAQVPHVTAKGRGFIAEQILNMAQEHDIPVREDPDLAVILEELDVGSPIPVAAFAAVAGILSVLYRTNSEIAQLAERTIHD